MTRVRVLVVAASLAACGVDRPIERTPADSFSFGVFGDGPYEFGEGPKFARVLSEVSRSDVQWLIHVGDLFWYPCSDAHYTERRAQLDAVAHPVIYTPGDNEWMDCYGKREGRYEPLDRLASLRRIFFATPDRSLGRAPMPLESQAADTLFAEFVENARWTRGPLVFATIHMIGSDNGYKTFRGRTAAHDSAAERRTRAAIAWLDGTFAAARRDSAKGIVIALHGNIGLEAGRPRRGYESFRARLIEQVRSFDGSVTLIHGDTHTARVDQPLADSAGNVLRNFTRIETFGSPKIGWLRIIVDGASGRITRVEPRLITAW